MIYSNLSGTTSNTFRVGVDGVDGLQGQLISGNCYDLWWRCVNPKTGDQNYNCIRLDNGINLNTIIYPGQYCRYNSNVDLLNSPTNNSFIMKVEPSSGDNAPLYIVQTITDTEGDKYIRAFNNGGAGAWKKIDYVPESGTFSLEPSYMSYAGIDIGFTIKSQSNKYILFNEMIIMKMSFTISMTNNSIVGVYPLEFKGLPISTYLYGKNIMGNLFVSGIINGVNGVPVSFYPSRISGSGPDSAFSIKFINNSKADGRLLTDTYLLANNLMNDTNTMVFGTAIIFDGRI